MAAGYHRGGALRSYFIQITGEADPGRIVGYIIGAQSEQEARDLACEASWTSSFNDLEYTEIEDLGETETPGITATFYK